MQVTMPPPRRTISGEFEEIIPLNTLKLMMISGTNKKRFRQAIDMLNEMEIVPEYQRSYAARLYLVQVLRTNSQSRLDYTKLGPIAIITQREYPEHVNTAATGWYTVAGLLKTLQYRFIDIGAYGRWWRLEAETRDWDVNPEEWDDPSHLS